MAHCGMATAVVKKMSFEYSLLPLKYRGTGTTAAVV
jgi:hypothetical protein